VTDSERVAQGLRGKLDHIQAIEPTLAEAICGGWRSAEPDTHVKPPMVMAVMVSQSEQDRIDQIRLRSLELKYQRGHLRR
jgi:hypothetical protein